MTVLKRWIRTILRQRLRVKLYHYTEYEKAFEEIKKQLSHVSVYTGEFDETWKEIEESTQTFKC